MNGISLIRGILLVGYCCLASEILVQVQSSWYKFFKNQYMGRYPVEGSGPDCKSGVSDSAGSIPARPTMAT